MQEDRRQFNRPAPHCGARDLRVRIWVILGALFLPLGATAVHGQVCQRTVTANVVALDQVFFWNRLGAFQPQGMIYALERDVVPASTPPGSCPVADPLTLEPGQVKLREGKRPRPLVLRMNVGDCLQINFRNLLDPQVRDEEQPHTRAASVHVVGLEAVNDINDMGINLGLNPTGGVVNPGQSTTYTLYGREEGAYLMYSGGAMVGGEGDAGSISAGLFGAVNVEPQDAEWYRSQVTRTDIDEAATYPTGSDFPVIDYDEVYTAGNDRCQPPGTYIFRMLDDQNEIIHSDLTAIITGPNRGDFPLGTYPPVDNIYPDRHRPFREFTTIFHDEIGAVQAFPHFNDRVLQHTLHSARDAFAINYGTGGIGAEILGMKLEVGPMHDCVECKYEEFFLTSWAVGDPAMVVDIPANEPCTTQQIRDGDNCLPTPGPKATKALYPDDPSNVYHSYLNDHVKFRNLHAGSDDHHVFHLHAHQWLHSPDNERSVYHDSQAIGQGASHTYEIAYNGSGNRNKTVGDSIFHCHLYPHFAQGMWSLWRVHDVLELGSELDSTGRPVSVTDANGVRTSTRALPDGEIIFGTPIPGVVPVPGQPMAPIPAPVELRNGQIDFSSWPTGNPGYPFFIPAKAGHRPPHPPLDTIHDGGLPRHYVDDGLAGVNDANRLSFHKVIDELEPVWVPESGTVVELLAMDFHSQGSHVTQTPEGDPGNFFVNAGTPEPGAPYADPCLQDNGTPIPVSRRYKAADIQMDIVLNKAGWHFPQQRLITLWEDVHDTLSGQRPPEPFFMRANDQECVEFWLTNLVPNFYELDDFQVRTPTDILGQHIHLVKFDVTSSDGAANGWNYEDGSFSPEEVVERIEAIRAANGCLPEDVSPPGDPQPTCPEPQPHPFFTPQGIDANCAHGDDWLGAQTTVQRWWADPVEDNDGVSRTLRTVFTHDHFGPSTHQQAGLYGALIVEPEGSTWYKNETDAGGGNVQLGTRPDGGPTSWQARIVDTPQGVEDFREFAIEFADFQLAYEPNGFGPPGDNELQLPECPDPNLGFSDPATVINPPGRKEVGLPKLFEKPDVCPVNSCDPTPFPGVGVPPGTPTAPLPPCPEAISADDPGFVSVNYRSEPVALRIRNPASNQQAAGEPGDLSFVYETRTDRADPLFNDISSPWIPYPDLTAGLEEGDPFTPLMRAYEGDPIKVRSVVGAHEEEHTFAFHGMQWLFEPDNLSSGLRSSQGFAISEFMDLEVLRVPSLDSGEYADFLYKPSNSNDFQWNGAWGLMRLYRRGELDDADRLPVLPSNSDGKRTGPTEDAQLFAVEDLESPNEETIPDVRISCPPGAPRREFEISAVWAKNALPTGHLVYNSRVDSVGSLPSSGSCTVDPGETPHTGPLQDESAVIFVRTSDLIDNPDGSRSVRPGLNIEPLILRARAGECIVVTLHNELPPPFMSPTYFDVDGYSGVPMIVEDFNSNDLHPSEEVGLHPQLVSVDVRNGDGVNVGTNRANFFNYKQTVAPGQSIKYFWYAGFLHTITNGQGQEEILWADAELGAVPLVSSDPIKHTQNAAVGALIVEPVGATWTHGIFSGPSGENLDTYAMADVYVGSFLPAFREFVAVLQDDINLVYGDGVAVRSIAVNDDPTETGQAAFNYRTEPIWFRHGFLPQSSPESTREITDFHLGLLDSFVGARPETPIFAAAPNSRVRFRVIHPGGDTQNHAFEVHGHLWQEEPWAFPAQQTPSSPDIATNLGANPTSNWFGAWDTLGAGRSFDLLLDGAGGSAGVTGEYLYRSYVPWAFENGMWGIFKVDASSTPVGEL